LQEPLKITITLIECALLVFLQSGVEKLPGTKLTTLRCIYTYVFFLEVFADSVTVDLFSEQFTCFFTQPPQIFSVKSVDVCFDISLWRTWQFVSILKSGSLIGWFSPNLFWCQVAQLKKLWAFLQEKSLPRIGTFLEDSFTKF